MRRFRQVSILAQIFLSRVGHRARAHSRAPERFGDSLHSPHRNARQIHLDQHLLDRGLASAVAFDDRSLKGLAPQLRYLEIDVPGTGLQHPLAAASPGIVPSFAAFVTGHSPKLIRLSIQRGVQRLRRRIPGRPIGRLKDQQMRAAITA